jgi:glutamate/tyrosine decarboxylase-like PLP-dependent enzyme
MTTHDIERYGSLEQSLDPPDWDSYRKLAHHALDEAIDYLKNVRDRPVWLSVPDGVKEQLRVAVPVKGQGIEKTYQDFQRLVLPYATGNIHPRFWGWVHGSGLATGLISELMAAAMNSNCGARDHGAVYVERQVIEWFRQIVGYPETASGLLVSGTSMGNIVGLAVARNAHVIGGARAQGVVGLEKKLITYTSSEAHSSVQKALELLGLGNSFLRKIPVDEKFSIEINTLRKSIKQDRSQGLQPFCVVGCAGTVNTGATDDLAALCEICREEGLWFHVDGAFGALCCLSEKLRPRARGLEASDSLAFDLHKWMHVQYDAGCVLIRDGRLHKETFATRPDYLQHTDRGLAGGGDWFTDLGPELSRGFRALKIWFALKEHGTKRFSDLIEQNCELAQYLAASITRNPQLELMVQPTLNIVCFRYRPKGMKKMKEAEVDKLNGDLVSELQERGIAVPSTTRIYGKLAIRVAITNHRSRREDLDLLLHTIIRIGAERLGVPNN